MTVDAPVVVRVARRYAAAPERVFDAWLNPDLIGRWLFGLTGGQEEVLRIAVDARVGGAFSFLVRRDGVEIDHVGAYLAIDRPRRLAFTWSAAGESNGQSRVTLDIAPLGDGCELTLTHEMDPVWAEYADRTAAGWTRILASLDDVLARRTD